MVLALGGAAPRLGNDTVTGHTRLVKRRGFFHKALVGLSRGARATKNTPGTSPIRRVQPSFVVIRSATQTQKVRRNLAGLCCLPNGFDRRRQPTHERRRGVKAIGIHATSGARVSTKHEERSRHTWALVAPSSSRKNSKVGTCPKQSRVTRDKRLS